jgi:putative membrane protein
MTFTTTSSSRHTPFLKNNWIKLYLLVFISLWTYTFIVTPDLNNWLLENTLVVLFLIPLILSYRKYPMSDLSYLLIALFLCVHVYGSTYTYAENPLGDWLKELFHTKRNQYDRIVHFSFGFLLAYPMREFFLNSLKLKRWLTWVLPVEISLSIGAAYELIEWAVADIFFKKQGAAYLGTQGDIWDAQKDMFLAFAGAFIAMIILSIKKTINK